MAIDRIPLWKENENWRARQQQMRDYLDNINSLGTNLTSAGADQSSGLAELVSKATLKRIQAEFVAKNAKAAAKEAQDTADNKALQAVKDRMKDLARVDVVV